MYLFIWHMLNIYVNICEKYLFIFELVGRNTTECCQWLSVSNEVINHFHSLFLFLFLCMFPKYF